MTSSEYWVKPNRALFSNFAFTFGSARHKRSGFYSVHCWILHDSTPIPVDCYHLCFWWVFGALLRALVFGLWVFFPYLLASLQFPIPIPLTDPVLFRGVLSPLSIWFGVWIAPNSGPATASSTSTCLTQDPINNLYWDSLTILVEGEEEMFPVSATRVEREWVDDIIVLSKLPQGTEG